MDPLLERHLISSIGHRFRLSGLQSHRGRQLNGRLCDVIGRQDPPSLRLIARLVGDEDSAPILVLNANLQDPEHVFNSAVRPDPVDGVTLRRYLKMAVRKHEGAAGPERPDIQARIKLVTSALESGSELPSGIKCMDSLCARDVASSIVRTMADAKVACTGDGEVHFTRFNEGLVGNGTECAICLSPTQMGGPVTGFPCLHVFHESCAATWLERNDNCPVCRYELPMAGRLYAFNGTHQLYTRISEWFVSGMCQRCQANYLERDPVMVVDNHDGNPPTLISRSQLPKEFC